MHLAVVLLGKTKAEYKQLVPIVERHVDISAVLSSILVKGKRRVERSGAERERVVVAKMKICTIEVGWEDTERGTARYQYPLSTHLLE